MVACSGDDAAVSHTGRLSAPITDEMMIPYISYTQLDEEGAKKYLGPKDGAYYRFWAF